VSDRTPDSGTPELSCTRRPDSGRDARSHRHPARAALSPLDVVAVRWRLRWLLLAALGLGVCWRTVRYALGFPFWGDEAFLAVSLMTRDFAGMIRPLEWGQIAPLGFMWAQLAISRSLGLSEWALRLLPTLAGLAGLLLFARFASDNLPRRAALLATAILASSYYVVRHATEFKPYETDLLVSLALTMLGWRVLRRPHCPTCWASLVLAGGLAPWLSYPSVFVAGGVGLTLTWALLRQSARSTPSFQSAIGWALYGLVLCGSFAAMYVIYARPHAESAARLVEIEMWSKAFPPLSEPWKLPLWLLAIHSGLMLAYPHGGTAPGSVVTLVLVIVGAAALAARSARRTSRVGEAPAMLRADRTQSSALHYGWATPATLVLLLLAPLPLALVAAAMKAYPYGGSARTMLYMAPAFCLLAGLGLWYLMLRWLPGFLRRHALHAALIALACLPIGGTIADVVRPYHSLESRRSKAIVVDLAARSRPADRWVVFNAVEPVDYAPWLGDWRGTGGQFVFDVLRLAPCPVDWAPRPQDVQPPGGAVWLLAYRGVRVEFPEEQCAAYLDALRQRLGPAEHEHHLIKTRRDRQTRQERIEALNVWRFGG
jgi:hypothetical protein